MKFSLAYNLSEDFLNTFPQQEWVELFFWNPNTKNSLNRFYEKSIEQKVFEQRALSLVKTGFQCNYLINSLKVDFSLLEREVQLMRNLGITIVTVADMEVISFLKKFPDIQIVVSIVAGIKTEAEVLSYLSLGNVKRIIFSQSVNHDFERLIKLVSFCKKEGIETELLANELCYSDCWIIKNHYLFDSQYNQKESVNVYAQNCKAALDPKILMNSPWIRPEDVLLYEKIWVDYLKISGRNSETEFLLRCIHAYLRREYEGNFFDLMDLDGKRVFGGKRENRYFLNKKLDWILLSLFKKSLRKLS